MLKKIFYKDFNFSPIFWLMILSFVIRTIFVYFYSDINMDNEWGTLFFNLYNFNSFSFYNFEDQLIPSVYMPPLYVFFLYFIKILSFEQINFINLVFFIQIILGIFSIYFFYNINKNFFSNKVSLINSYVFSLVPLNIYVVGQISSINIQIFLSLLFIQLFFLISNKDSLKNAIIFSIISGLLLLTRGEFILILFISFSYLILFKKIKIINFFIIILISLIVISPYLARNYLTFEKITIVKSFGYNLWKGNNQLSLVEGSGFKPRISFDDQNYNFADENLNLLKKKVNEIVIDKYYEFKRDKIFLDQAIKNLSNNPDRYSILFLKKIFSFYFVDFNSNYPSYYNPIHLFPILIISILSFPGFFIAMKKKNFQINYILIYVILNIIIFSIFFILPRYKLIILPMQIIMASFFLKYIYDKIFLKSKFDN